MAVTLVTGALGAGKGLYCSMLAVNAYRNGRRVAANYPLDMEKLDKNGTQAVSVIPKQFSYEDLMSLGSGCPDGEFENLGILLIDEVSLSLNARTFKDTERLKFIDWFVHSRKYGWDVYFQVQQSFMLDKQLVEGVSEFIVELSRMDSLKIPVVSTFLELFFPKTFGRTAKKKSLLPHFVKYRVYLAKERGKKMPIEKGNFRAKDFFGVHDTLSTFGATADSDGAYSLLSAKTLTAHLPTTAKPGRSFRTLVKGGLQLLLVIAIPFLLYWYWFGRTDTLTVPENTSATESVTPQKTAIPPAINPTEKDTINTPPALSQHLRLVGYITIKGQSKLIIKDMQSGLIRYVHYESPFGIEKRRGYEIDGELVTEYSGVMTEKKDTVLSSSSPDFFNLNGK